MNEQRKQIDREGGSPGLRILVVDDSTDETRLLQRFLEEQGFQVCLAGSGPEATEQIQQQHPDLILLDIVMPDMSGIDVCRSLKSGFETMNIPVVMISGQEHPDAIVDAFESGADDYVIKPFDLPTLLARIRANLRRTSREITTNPLTRIPGINFLHSHFPRLAARNPNVCLALCDIDNFKAFNDRYSIEEGDRVIRALADILRRGLEPLGPDSTILVHVGGDDFIFVCPRQDVDRICQDVIQEFDTGVPAFYNPQDRTQGYIKAVNRRGHTEIYPLMTLSIGVAPNYDAQPQGITVLTEAANEVKNYLKKQTLSTYMINRRRRR